MIDEGEADWKILAIRTDDPLANKLNDLNDLIEEVPSILDATRDWLRIYKVPDGSPPNNFAMNGQYFDRNFSLDLIKHAHEAWANLINQKSNQKISLVNTCVNNKHTISNAKAREILNDLNNKFQACKDEKKPFLERNHYVNRNKLSN